MLCFTRCRPCHHHKHHWRNAQLGFLLVGPSWPGPTQWRLKMKCGETGGSGAASPGWCWHCRAVGWTAVYWPQYQAPSGPALISPIIRHKQITRQPSFSQKYPDRVRREVVRWLARCWGKTEVETVRQWDRAGPTGGAAAQSFSVWLWASPRTDITWRDVSCLRSSAQCAASKISP